MALKARSATEAAFYGVLALPEIAYAILFKFFCNLDLLFVANFDSICEPIQEPWLARVLANHPFRKLTKPLILKQGLSPSHQLNIFTHVRLSLTWFEASQFVKRSNYFSDLVFIFCH